VRDRRRSRSTILFACPEAPPPPCAWFCSSSRGGSSATAAPWCHSSIIRPAGCCRRDRGSGDVIAPTWGGAAGPLLAVAEQFVGRGDQTDCWIRAAIFAELLGVGNEFVGVDDRRVFLVFVVAVEPGQDDLDSSGLLAWNCLQVWADRSMGAATPCTVENPAINAATTIAFI
jgi:hypothetical protein